MIPHCVRQMLEQDVVADFVPEVREGGQGDYLLWEN